MNMACGMNTLEVKEMSVEIYTEQPPKKRQFVNLKQDESGVDVVIVDEHGAHICYLLGLKSEGISLYTSATNEIIKTDKIGKVVILNP